MGSWMGTPGGAVSTVMFRPRCKGIEMKLAGGQPGSDYAFKSRPGALWTTTDSSQRRKDQADVQPRRGVGERSHAYEVDPCLRDRTHGLEGHAARGLERCPAGGERHRLAQLG